MNFVDKGPAAALLWTGLACIGLSASAAAAPPVDEVRAQRDEDALEADDVAAIRLLPFDLLGGLSRPEQVSGVAGFRVLGCFADTPGGEVVVGDLAALWLSQREAFTTRIFGLEGRALFACRARRSGDWIPPLAAWFQDCEPGGSIGLDGALLGVELDGRTGRVVARPIELALALDVLGTAFTPAFFRRRLVIFAGGSVDTTAFPSGIQDVGVHAVTGLRGLLRTWDLGVELEGYAALRQGFSDLDDRAIEAGVRVFRRLEVGGESDGRPPQATVRLGLELGASYWSRPSTSMASFVSPLVSDHDTTTLHALVTLGVWFGRLSL